MPKFDGEAGFKHGTKPRVGILITNLGSPDAATASAVRRYLAEFLMDPRVVEVPRILWRIIMHGIILRFRPRRSAKAYQAVWTDDGSPLVDITRQQQHALKQRLQTAYGKDISVEFAMRYGKPSIYSTLAKMRERNVRKLLLLPLYPQYSAVTSASTFDAVAKAFARTRWIPELRTINQYHDHPDYIRALAESIREFWQEKGRGEKILFSFHGIPKKYLVKGDPYHCQCHVTARLLAQELDLSADKWTIAFQSRLGREEWLKPYTSETIEQWGQAGLKKIDTICPGFSADCVETLEEMILEYGDLFVKSGGEELRYVPCLNSNVSHIDLLEKLALDNLHPWLGQQAKETLDKLTQSRQRAVELGASQ